MSLQKLREKNSLYGKNHKYTTIELMCAKAINGKASTKTKEKMSKSKGNPVKVYELSVN